MEQQTEVVSGVGRRDVERLCRLCATITTHPNQRVDIFAVDGLRSKIETCLPVLVSKDSLLPDTLCSICNEKICAFFTFRKRSLETLKILEENFHVIDTCFKPLKPIPSTPTYTTTSGSTLPKLTKATETDNLNADASQFEEWKTKKLATFHYDNESYTSKQENRRKLLNCAVEMEKANRILADARAERNKDKLVEYDSSDKEEDEYLARIGGKSDNFLKNRNKLYFDDKVNDLINEIQERKSTKRKLEAMFDNSTSGGLEGEGARSAKMFKRGLNLGDLFPDSGLGGGNRRKKRPPARMVKTTPTSNAHGIPIGSTRTPINMSMQNVAKQLEQLPQVCLLCDQQFPKGTMLAKHVFDTHGIDMAQVLSSEPIPEGMTRTLHANLQNLQNMQTIQNMQNLQHQNLQSLQNMHSVTPVSQEYESMLVEDKSPGSPRTSSSAEKKKKLPELVKITDLKTKRDSIEMKVPDDAPPTLTASYVCPLCPASLTNKIDLYAHLRVRHAQHAKLICGLCLNIATSVHTLQEHLESCTKTHAVVGYFVCQVCKYAEDNQKSLENHILVHDFLLADCKKDGKIFDPSDFMDTNEACEPKFYSCTECGSSLQSFKEYSSHKRSEHSIFHCDLCNKSYGRNSHLWKHVNRVHKGHPSVTCQFCSKTSASKYHLLQHFNKIHTQKQGISLGSMSSSSHTHHGPGLSSSSGGNSSKVKNGEVLSEFEEDDFMTKKFDPFDFQSVRQSFMRAEMEAKKSGSTTLQPGVASDGELPKKTPRSTEMRDLSSLKMPTVPPKELDSSSTIYTNIITNYTPPTNDGEYKCPKCSKAFHKRTLLKKHKKNCRPRLQKDLLTRCKSCSRIFKDRQSLAKHLVNYHSEYSCEMCNEKVQSKCEIVSHIRFTHPGCHLICQLCGNVLRNNDLLRAHLQDHTNSFVCQFCGDILPSKIKLKMHILSLHRKILSLSCGVCLKLFESQHILRDHVRMVHREALQPLTSCTVCGKNYGSKWKTYDHLNKSHGRVFRACKVCLEVFNNEQELQTHMDMHHTKGMKKYVPAENLPPFEPQTETRSDIEEESEGEEEDGIKDEFEGKSILEKHLVGAYVHRNNNQHQQLQLQQVQAQLQGPVPHGGPQTKQNGLPMSPVTPKSNKHSSEELINSSKRTVYVNSNDPSVCDICHKNWPAKKHLWQHYIRCHKQVAATVCGICLCTNKTYADLQRHLNAEHPTLLHGKGFGSNFICRICGRYHNASSKLKLHMAIHIKFDWSLLDNPTLQNNAQIKQNPHHPDQEDQDPNEYEDVDDEEDEVETVPEQQIKFKVKIKPPQKNPMDDVNYESMIEQVECSTNSSSSSESDGDGEEEGDDGQDEGDVDEGDEAEDDEDDDDEEGEVEEDEEQATSQIKEEAVEGEEDEEDEQEVEEMSDEDDEEDEDEADEDGDEEEGDVKQEELHEEVKYNPPDNHISEQEGDLLHVHQQEHDDIKIKSEDDGVHYDDDDQEYEEVVEEVVHQDDLTIYEQEEIIEGSYIEDETGQFVINHLVQHHQPIMAQVGEVHEEVEQMDDDDDEEEEEEEVEEDDEETTSSLSHSIIYDNSQVTYVQEGDAQVLDVDSAVQSICYEEDDSCHDGNVAEEYEVQSTNAPGMNNQHEIQSAVDSIL